MNVRGVVAGGMVHLPQHDRRNDDHDCEYDLDDLGVSHAIPAFQWFMSIISALLSKVSSKQLLLFIIAR